MYYLVIYLSHFSWVFIITAAWIFSLEDRFHGSDLFFEFLLLSSIYVQ